jgi:hypothetical protein
VMRIDRQKKLTPDMIGKTDVFLLGKEGIS